MGHIRFTANLQRHVPCPDQPVRGSTVRAALDAVFTENPRLRSYILDEQGRLRRHVNVHINQRAVTDRTHLSDPLADADDLYVFQALSGG
ncbi:MoaD/ThiS family protein [Azospirillum sp. RWY-5-1]|uniref:MoaD/ThiS family protein n=1 Tax=Azospirillum oleiclasticum TaxID=2735135 RepID=A0ABX2T2M1_9PROT|nr:MoaD/ThiS family protein [Azospirillum oleiclasticum]NYZ11150.1 MoaD/ThiS family protein [Azospirillum oleiclasticum]NYZ18312.1 MoaD/ThiS family protein [Azospirillum oleiclasticum]